MRRTIILLASAMLVAAAPPPDLGNMQLGDPAKEAQARALMEELRCLTCQSQSIADSDADMAVDMRHLVRSRIAAGDSSDEIRAFLVDRYGDYVTYAPAARGGTWPLYAIPAILLLAGLAIFLRRLRRGGLA